MLGKQFKCPSCGLLLALTAAEESVQRDLSASDDYTTGNSWQRLPPETKIGAIAVGAILGIVILIFAIVALKPPGISTNKVANGNTGKKPPPGTAPKPPPPDPPPKKGTSKDFDNDKGAVACAGCGTSCAAIIIIPIMILILNIALLVWVSRDAKARGMGGFIWMFLVLMLGLLGLIIYLFARTQGQLVQCATCMNKRLLAIRLCPHCGNA